MTEHIQINRVFGAETNKLRPSQTITPKEILQAINGRDRILNLVPGLAESSALKAVFQEYISIFARIEQAASLPLDEYEEQRFDISRGLSFPAREKDPLRWLDIEVSYARQKPDYLRERSESFAHTLVCHIGKLHSRITTQPVLGEGVSWERKWKGIQDGYHEKQRQLASCLRQAADIFEEGQVDSGVYASLMKYRELDEKAWCGPDQLREWAELVEISPVEVVFPKARQDLPGLVVDYDNVGVRGGAANPESALRAMIVRETGVYVPLTMPKRFKVITDLVKCIGISVIPQYVRSLLMKGHT